MLDSENAINDRTYGRFGNQDAHMVRETAQYSYGRGQNTEQHRAWLWSTIHIALLWKQSR